MKTKEKEIEAAESAEDIEVMRVKLSALDPVLAIAHEAVEPFQWDVRQRGFAGLVQLITEQQLSTASAAAIWKRFKAGVREVTSKNLRNYDIDTLKSFGLSRPKAVYVKAIAESEMSGAIDFGTLENLDDETATKKLTELKGAGRWTAEVYLMFCEGRTDLFPAGDLGLQEGFGLAARVKNRPSEKELYARAERWRPYRGVAANLLWSYYSGVKAGRIKTIERKNRKATLSKQKANSKAPKQTRLNSKTQIN